MVDPAAIRSCDVCKREIIAAGFVRQRASAEASRIIAQEHCDSPACHWCLPCYVERTAKQPI